MVCLTDIGHHIALKLVTDLDGFMITAEFAGGIICKITKIRQIICEYNRCQMFVNS